jgi:hypothetical protein
MKKRLLGYLLGVVAVVGTLAFLGIRLVAPDEPLQGREASWLSHYDNYATLVKESEVIIVGKVAKSTPFSKEEGGLVFTTQEVEVQEVIGGDVSVGDILPIIQTGGILEGKETHPFVDSPLMEEGKIYLLFLERSQLDSEIWWWIMGGYQGRVDIRRNGTLHLIQYRVDRNETVARELHRRKLEDAKSEIRQILERTTPAP